MGTMTIDGRAVEFTDERNVLTIIRKAGIQIPTLCYQPELSTFGACRLCTVQDDKGKLFASCSEEPRDGMVIYTNTAKLRKYRKLIVELLLAAHCRDCTTCRDSGECKLQDLAHKMGIREVRFQNYKEEHPIDMSSPSIVRDPNKCILCGNCVRVCDEIQSVGALGFANRGTEALVIPAFNKDIASTECVNCGQCRVMCPTGAITIRSNRSDVWEVLGDDKVRVVAQVAPSVRVAVGDHFGLPRGKDSIGKIISAMHRIGFDEVYDTIYSADLTIMEESAEFLDRVANGGTLPLLTSCCPAWVKFVTDQYKEFIPNVSTCRSPQGMMSAVVKEYFRDPEKAGDKKTVMVSIMPCTAKKAEAIRPNSVTKGEPDTDYVLTTTELIRMIEEYGLNLAELEPEEADSPFGIGSGGGVIFGVTGGVTEAVLRRLAPDEKPETIQTIAESGVRGYEGIKEFTVPYNGMNVNICVASGLANARTVLERVKSGEASYHLIEVMACPGGCVMGGGQPVDTRDKVKRTEGIFEADEKSAIKKPDANPLMDELYARLSHEQVHELLHNEFY